MNREVSVLAREVRDRIKTILSRIETALKMPTPEAELTACAVIIYSVHGINGLEQRLNLLARGKYGNAATGHPNQPKS